MVQANLIDYRPDAVLAASRYGKYYSSSSRRHNQHVNVNGVDQLARRRHQFAPEVPVMTANDQIHIVFLDGVNQHWPKSPLPLRVSVIG